MNKVKGYRKRDGTYVHSHWRKDKVESVQDQPLIENAKEIEDARRHRNGE